MIIVGKTNMDELPWVVLAKTLILRLRKMLGTLKVPKVVHLVAVSGAVASGQVRLSLSSDHRWFQSNPANFITGGWSK